MPHHILEQSVTALAKALAAQGPSGEADALFREADAIKTARTK